MNAVQRAIGAVLPAGSNADAVAVCEAMLVACNGADSSDNGAQKSVLAQVQLFCAHIPVWFARLRVSGAVARLYGRRGGGGAAAGACHT